MLNNLINQLFLLVVNYILIIFQIRLNAYGATEAGPISVSLSGGENMGMLACRVKVKVNAKKS